MVGRGQAVRRRDLGRRSEGRLVAVGGGKRLPEGSEYLVGGAATGLQLPGFHQKVSVEGLRFQPGVLRPGFDPLVTGDRERFVAAVPVERPGVNLFRHFGQDLLGPAALQDQGPAKALYLPLKGAQRMVQPPA